MCRSAEIRDKPLDLPGDIHFFREEGETLEGMFVRYETDPRPGKSDIQIAVLELSEGKLCALFLASKVLAAKFKHAAPKRGDRVEVIFKGERVAFAGYAYADFEVRVKERVEDGSSGHSRTIMAHPLQRVTFW